jgi:uncharacterized membrane protein (UPF0127 family)
MSSSARNWLASSRSAPLLLAALLLTGCEKSSSTSVVDGAPKPQSLPTTQLKVGPRTFTLQIANTDATRQVGLMYRRAMPLDEGMFFIFPTEVPRAFWMKNTPIDLDILFLDHNGKVVSIRTMYAYDQTSIPSDEPAKYAIEINAGVVAAAGLKVGMVVDIPADLRDSAR